MTTLTVTAKGQVTLRRELLDHLDARPGDRLSVEPLPDGGVALRRLRPAGSIGALFGRLHRPGGPVLSVAQMNAVTAEGWAGRAASDTGDDAGPDNGNGGGRADPAADAAGNDTPVRSR